MTSLSPDLIPALGDLTDREFRELLVAVLAENQRRLTLTEAAVEMEQLQQRVEKALGRTDGDEWAPVANATQVYRLDAIVTHNGRTYRSLHPYNSWEPGTDSRLWEDLTVDEPELDPETGEELPPEWVQPIPGLPDKPAYHKGAVVRYGGHVWESTFDGDNVWPPVDDIRFWKKV